MRPETRGFAFGLALGLAALGGFGAAQLTPGSEGRYVTSVGGAGTPPQFKAYLTDTVSGHVWRIEGSQFISVGMPKRE